MSCVTQETTCHVLPRRLHVTCCLGIYMSRVPQNLHVMNCSGGNMSCVMEFHLKSTWHMLLRGPHVMFCPGLSTSDRVPWSLPVICCQEIYMSCLTLESTPCLTQESTCHVFQGSLHVRSCPGVCMRCLAQESTCDVLSRSLNVMACPRVYMSGLAQESTSDVLPKSLHVRSCQGVYM